MSPPVSLSINSLRAWATYEAALDGAAPFVEFLWDNYCTIEPSRFAELAASVSGAVSLHVMRSGFLLRDAASLAELLRRLRRFVDAARPVRVSDHLLAAVAPDGLHLREPLEYDYGALDRARARVDAVQQRLGMPLLVENFASADDAGAAQPDFVAALMARTGCGLLFDVSNAVVAERNGGAPADAWLPLLAGRPVDCHIGGFSRSRGGRLIDSHGADLADESLALLRRVAACARVTSVCLEREYNVSEAGLRAELARLRDAVAEARDVAA